MPDTPHPQIVIQESQIEVLFSPDDVVVSRLLQLLRDARESIHFLAYSFNSDDLGDVIRERSAQGVTVSGVIEPVPLNTGISEFESFREAGLDVRLGNSSALLHHNVIVIDGEIVITGS